ncbi:cation-transporting P-type ATPase, partial [Idiomarina sp. Sol25]|nr:cation-transporting P-type ATPase [Idiomarina sp. Sol25]
QEVPIADLVPGDIVQLAAGDMVPADVRVLNAKDLFVSQAMLTGESMPVEKHASPPTDHATGGELLDLPTVCFMGSNVVSGSATVAVAATGDTT